VSALEASAERYTLPDGLGVRGVEQHALFGWVEVREVAPRLVLHPAAEPVLRARAAWHAGLRGPRMARVWRIDRDGGALRVITDLPGGVRLSDLLADLEFGNDTLSDAGLLDVAEAVIRAVSALHRAPGGFAHGALSPAHVVLAGDGAVVLTDESFDTALEALRKNRAQMWREFGLALPPSANAHRFDQRADVTQLGALVLAIVVRRTLRPDEYPAGIGDLVVTATPERGSRHASALQHWLQQALHLQPRTLFSSATLAERAFADVTAMSVPRPTGGAGVPRTQSSGPQRAAGGFESAAEMLRFLLRCNDRGSRSRDGWP
jgi:hypothetical protein